MSKPVYRCWTKATSREQGAPRRSLSWIFSRRGWFVVYPDRVECGNWNIPAAVVKEAVLYQVKQFFFTSQVLSLQAEGVLYQFGFNPWCAVRDHLPFEVRVESIRLGHSRLSILIRMTALAYLVYLFWRALS